MTIMEYLQSLLRPKPDPDDLMAYGAAVHKAMGGVAKDAPTLRQVAKCINFTGYEHIFIPPPQAGPHPWINPHDEIIFTKEDDMSEKTKKALEAARLFIGGLSQYDNKVLPKGAYQEAQGVLQTIGEAQGFRETPPPEAIANGAPYRSAPLGKGMHDGHCDPAQCHCRLVDASLLTEADWALWQLVSPYTVLRMMTMKSDGRRRFWPEISIKSDPSAFGRLMRSLKPL